MQSAITRGDAHRRGSSHYIGWLVKFRLTAPFTVTNFYLAVAPTLLPALIPGRILGLQMRYILP